jgi:hypothetical protein
VDLNIINLRIGWVNGFGGAQEKQPSSLQKEVLANCEFQLIYVLKVQKWWQKTHPIDCNSTHCYSLSLAQKILCTKTSWKSWNSNKFCILGYYFFINCVKAQTINRGLKYLQWSFGNMYKSYATQLTAILSCLIHENRSIVFLYFSFYNPWAGVSYIPLAGYCILPMSKKASLNLFDLF